MARTQRPAGTHPSPPGPVTPPAPGSVRARAARRAGPGPLAGAAAVAALALAGCGGVTAAQSVTTSADSSSVRAPAAVAASHLLCARPGAVSQVAIARTGTLPRVLPGPLAGSAAAPLPRLAMPRLPAKPARTPGPGTTVVPGMSVGPREPIEMRPPAARTVVRSSARARDLARALCGLPPFPHVPVNCPALIAGYYRLSFTADGRRLPVVTVQDTGCQTVTGLGTVRQAATRPGFWALLSGLAGPPAGLPVHLPGLPVHLPGLPVHLPGQPVSPAGPNRPLVS
jgi:hypothetical protein